MFFRLIRLSVLLSLSELKEKSLIRNDPDKSEFTTTTLLFCRSLLDKGQVAINATFECPLHGSALYHACAMVSF